MRVIHTLLQRTFSFLFPAPYAVAELETWNADTIAQQCPEASALKDINHVALFSYRSPMIKRAIWEVKYRGNRRIAELLATCLADRITADLEEELRYNRTPVLAPVALDPKRLRERGWSQSKLLSDTVAAKLGPDITYIPSLLVRHERRTAQTELRTKGEREQNMHNIFSVHIKERARIKNAHIILIDDVVTTGATFRDARRALIEAGAHEVWAYAVAH